MTVCRQPCPSCPWRVDQDAAAIPHFGAAQFACHQSRPGEEIVCAGWLATQGAAHPGVRLNVALGAVPAEALSPGDDWPPLHAEFAEVIEKLRASA